MLRQRITTPFVPGEVGFAMDSGAFTLTARMQKASGPGSEKTKHTGFFEDGAGLFWDYLQHYAEYLQAYEDRLDFYVTLDAIGAEWGKVVDTGYKTWKTLKTLEEWGLNPIPVYHIGENEFWLKYYLDNYEYIGIGGFGIAGKVKHYFRVARDLFNRFILDSSGKPRCKVHGFAITSLGLQLAVPWYSVDSASWTFTGANGAVLIPKYNFKGGIPYEPRWMDIPMTLYVKHGSKHANFRDRHHSSVSATARRAVDAYFDLLNVDLEPLRESPDYRNTLNLAYFMARQKIIQDTYRNQWGVEDGGHLYFAGHPANSSLRGVRILVENLKLRLKNLPGLDKPRFLGTYIDNPYIPYLMAACGMKMRMRENVKGPHRKTWK